MNWNAITDWIEQETRLEPIVESRIPVGGGCINQAFQIGTKSGRDIFVKINSGENVALFEAETAGLNQLRETKAIRVPEPLGFGIAGDHSILVMEAIDLCTSMKEVHQADLGTQLGELHVNVSTGQPFGNHFDNYIGRTPQSNQWTECWTTFFINSRLDYQFKLAGQNGWAYPDREELYASIRDLLPESPPPALLHGDLWSGNAAFDDQGAPVIYDPACYYGDREAEIAFTRMFGGFSAAFYRAYREIHPSPPQEARLHRLYNLYHELNHFNLFGGGYRQQALDTISFLLNR